MTGTLRSSAVRRAWNSASVVSKVQPVVNGHLVTVTVSFTNYNKKVNLQLQSLVNKLSAGQP